MLSHLLSCCENISLGSSLLRLDGVDRTLKVGQIQLALGIVGKIVGIIPFLGTLIGFVLGAVWVAIALSLAYGVTKGYALRIPVVGDWFNIF